MAVPDFESAWCHNFYASCMLSRLPELSSVLHELYLITDETTSKQRDPDVAKVPFLSGCNRHVQEEAMFLLPLRMTP